MRTASENASADRERSARQRTVVVAFLLVVVAWFIYRPDRLRPFYVVDFSEFVPLLQAGDGFLDNTSSVFEYYASQGRFNAIPYVLLVAKWHVFSWWSPGWQAARALVMVALFGLTFVLLRRLRASRSGAIVGASAYLWAPSAADGWVHLTMAEPLGAVLMLGLAIRALTFQSTARWRREVVLMAVGAVALIWSKELMAPLLLLPVGLALIAQADGSFALPKASRRNASLVAAVSVTSALALVPVLLVFLNAGEGAYASIYGKETRSLESIAIWITALAPFDLVVLPPNVLWTLALFGFATLIAFGWPAGFRSAVHHPRARWLLIIALLVPLIGVLAYVPVPWYARFYTLPYLIGAAILSGMAVTFLQEAGRQSLALAASTAFIVQAMNSAATVAAQTDATQRRDALTIAFVADSVASDSVYFATTHVPPHEWLGMGSSLRRFASTTNHTWPPLRHIDCETARRASESTHSAIIDLDSTCGLSSEAMRVIAVPFRRVDGSRARVVVDTTHVDIVLPSSTPRTP